MADPATIAGQVDALQQLLSAGGSLLGGGGGALLMVKFMANRLTTQWGEVVSSIKALDARVAKVEAMADSITDIRIKIAAHEAIARDNERLRKDLDEAREKITLLTAAKEKAHASDTEMRGDLGRLADRVLELERTR